VQRRHLFAIAIALGGALLLFVALRALLAPDPSELATPTEARFRCGYAAQRAGIEDPECAEVARPRPPRSVTVEAERDPVDPDA
jgi:hypothetical protein